MMGTITCSTCGKLVSQASGSFVPAARSKPERLRADVKVFDASKVDVQLVEEANDKKVIETVGSSTHRVKRPAYIEHGLDPEVAAALDNSEGLEFDSADELDDDFIVYANCNPKGSTSQAFQAPGDAALRNRNFSESSVLEEDEDEEEFSDTDVRSVADSERPRPNRLLDEQFEKVGLFRPKRISTKYLLIGLYEFIILGAGEALLGTNYSPLKLNRYRYCGIPFSMGPVFFIVVAYIVVVGACSLRYENMMTMTTSLTRSFQKPEVTPTSRSLMTCCLNF